MATFIALFVSALPFILVLLLFSIKQVNEYERGVMLSFGKFTGVKTAGWRIVIPVFQRMYKIDMRVTVVDVPDQEAITKDNISVRINAVIYYKVADASKAFLEVQNFAWAVSQLAQTTMRNIVGEVTLDGLLKNRDEVADSIKLIVDKASDPWGILVETVELKDIVLPENLKRTMAKEAEAEREKRAVIINASGELEAAKDLSAAAKLLSDSPGALHLRTLQSINDLSSDQSNTVVWMVPVEALEALQGLASFVKK